MIQAPPPNTLSTMMPCTRRVGVAGRRAWGHGYSAARPCYACMHACKEVDLFVHRGKPMTEQMKDSPRAGAGGRWSPCSCGTCRSPGTRCSGIRRPAQSRPDTCCRWSQRQAPRGCAGGTAPSCCCAWRGACCRTGSGCPGRATGIAAPHSSTGVSQTNLKRTLCSLLSWQMTSYTRCKPHALQGS